MDTYNELQQKLNTHPAGAPDRPEFLEILRMLFTPEEAELAVQLAFRPKRVDDIAQKAGLSADEAASLCEGLADKGLVFCRTRDGDKAYALQPLVPGIFEMPFMGRKHIDVDFSRLGELWEQYYDNGQGQELHSSKTSFLRVLPVRKAIPSAINVLPFEEVSNYIDKADHISVADCACRVAEKRCNNPIEVCFAFDDGARFLVERKLARFVTKEEALKILQECEDIGLVHCTSNTSDRLMLLCNCCPCCCHALGAITRIKDTVSHPVSNFYASVNVDDCNACGVCEDRCPAEAIAVDDVAAINVSLCIGCGLCASACPTDAIALNRRDESIEPPANIRELYLKMAEEKGRVEAFMGNLA
ncbi:MAG: 4Fe-4S binding protein [Dehalococcoidia bacterium]|nr:4Fe-4S binding protein [Dehalococcoidia bacterium]